MLSWAPGHKKTAVCLEEAVAVWTLPSCKSFRGIGWEFKVDEQTTYFLSKTTFKHINQDFVLTDKHVIIRGFQKPNLGLMIWYC